MKIKMVIVSVLVVILFTACVNVNINLPEKQQLQESAVPQNETVEIEEVQSALQSAPQQAVVNEAENLLLNMDSAARREVNIFLSNFSEAYYEPNSGYCSLEEEKIGFAYTHSFLNSPSLTFYEGDYMGMTAANVDAILNRFFGNSVPHETPKNSKEWFYENGKFLMRAASGEFYGYFSTATNMTKRADGNYDVAFNIYADYSEEGIESKSVYKLTDSEATAAYDYCGSGQAVLKAKVHNGSNTYELVSYSVNK